MRWLRATFLPASLLVLAAAGLIVPLPGDVLSPGRVVPLAPCVDIDDAQARPIDGDFLLMTIYASPASTFDAVIAAFDPQTTFDRQLVPRGIDPHQYYGQQREVFNLARNVAVAVALEEAGTPAEVIEEGARVLQTAAGTPAAEALRAGDIITEVDGEPVASSDALRELVSSSAEGATLPLRVVRGDRALTIDLTPVERDGVPIIGVLAETVLDVELPFPVEVSTGPVGGPSAGLMIALTVYDKVLPGVDVAAGRIVAGTGTLDRDGNVGPVGGAGLKVIAASQAGADVFLAPRRNADEARAALPADSEMQIVEVATLEQAIEALEEAGRERPDGAQAAETCPYQES